MEIPKEEVGGQMRVGRIAIRFGSFYLEEIGMRYPNIRIEEYITNLYKRSYDALIVVYIDRKEFPVLASRAKRAFQKSESIDCFEFIGEADKAFYQITVNSLGCARSPIRCLQTVDGYFPSRIFPTEEKQGIVYIYGAFEDENAFNQCIEILDNEQGIDVQKSECESWTIDDANAFDSVPTIFNALGIDPKQAEVLLRVLFGNSSSALHLAHGTNFIDTFLTSDLLRNMEFLQELAYTGMHSLIDILKEIFWRD